MNTTNRPKNKIGLTTAISIVTANMVGTGVYTSLGFQAMDIDSVFALLMLWVAGGVMALCGALTYAELSSAMPRSGGEYNFLTRLYHPLVGFNAGWVSITLGFTAPMAASCMAFGNYFGSIIESSSSVVATILLCAVLVINLFGIRSGGKVQLTFTLINISLIVVLSTAGIIWGNHEHFKISATSEDLKQILNPSFFVSLVYVSFAYSGWNAITYITEDIDNPRTNIPRALFAASTLVMILYLCLNFIFLYNVPIEELKGKLEVAFVAAEKIFGVAGAKIVAAIICIGLVASVNSMMMIGPGTAKVLGEDYPLFKKLSWKSKSGSSVYALLLQFLIALILIHTATFKQVTVYIGFTLSMFTVLTVIGIFIYRYKNKSITHYTTWGYPLTPILFIVIELSMMVYVMIENTYESLLGLLTIMAGIVVYFVNHYLKKDKLINQ